MVEGVAYGRCRLVVGSVLEAATGRPFLQLLLILTSLLILHAIPQVNAAWRHKKRCHARRRTQRTAAL